MNRLGEICEEANATEWRSVPTKENPADDATQRTPDVLQNDSRWFLGASFLRQGESKWPRLKLNLKF